MIPRNVPGGSLADNRFSFPSPPPDSSFVESGRYLGLSLMRSVQHSNSQSTKIRRTTLAATWIDRCLQQKGRPHCQFPTTASNPEVFRTCGRTPFSLRRRRAPSKLGFALQSGIWRIRYTSGTTLGQEGIVWRCCPKPPPKYVLAQHLFSLSCL